MNTPSTPQKIQFSLIIAIEKNRPYSNTYETHYLLGFSILLYFDIETQSGLE